MRIGLVMYGGVSLAIYMNGVANELFRAVRGRGVYKLFKDITDCDVVVDVVSGASAGGINGMFLAYALSNGLEFGTCAELWRKRGDISDLLRKPDSPRESQTSLLDSEGYYEPQLAGAFRDMWQRPLGHEPAASAVDELDLFVTGTDFNGRLSTTVDAAGHVIEIKDHRTTFWLKHRASRKQQLHPAAAPDGTGAPAAERSPALDPELRDQLERGFAAFAKLARITSCFPAAFAPVFLEVPPRGAADGDDCERSVARKLGLWGKLGPGPYHFLDGGILDNKPFTSTIETIFYRMTNRPVQRHLLYVEPDPERFRNDAPRAPTFISSALDSLTRLPSYESIAADLQQIAKHNDSVQRYTRTCAELRNTVMLQPAARDSRSERPRAAASREHGAASAIYQNACRQALGELALERLVASNPRGAGGEAPRERITALRRAFDEALRKLSPTDTEHLLSELDVEFRLRRLIHLTYVLLPETESGDLHTPRRSQVPGPIVAPRPERLLSREDTQDALERLSRRIALLEIVRSQMLRAIERRAVTLCDNDPGEVWLAVNDVLARVLDARDLDPELCRRIADDTLEQHDLERLRALLEQRSEAAAQAGSSDTERRSLLTLTDRGEQQLVARYRARPDVNLPPQLINTAPFLPIQHEYAHFRALDTVLFPMQFVADLREQDVIRTVRVSPLDAQRGLSRGSHVDKVTGETLAHFGAFLKRSWRSNDILCGRLDGACQLIETLLNISWLRTSLGKSERRARALSALSVAAAEQTDDAQRSRAIARYLREAQIFPRAPDDAIERAAVALSELLDPDETLAFEKRLAGKGYEELLDALVEATHQSILCEEYHKLVDDSIEEQLRWRAGPYPGDQAAADDMPASKLPRFEPSKRAFDTELSDLALIAAAQHFSKQAAGGALGAAELRKLHVAYPVGAESLERHVPRTVLLELVAHALLIARNCILGSLGPERAAAIRKNAAYRLFVDWPLRVFHALAVQLRARPAQAGILLGLLGYAVLAVLINVLFGGPTWKVTGWRASVAQIAFVAVPLACAAFLAAILAGSEYGRRGAGSWIAALLRGGFRLLTALAVLFAIGFPIYLLSAGFEPVATKLLSPIVGKFWKTAGDNSGRILVLALCVILGAAIGALWKRLYRGDLSSRIARALKHTKFGMVETELLFKRVLNGRMPTQNPAALAEHKRELLRRALSEERLDVLNREMRMLVPDAF